ncbi:MAG: hypothetical protein U0X92_09085 [Anaerolineales bacterium]
MLHRQVCRLGCKRAKESHLLSGYGGKNGAPAGTFASAANCRLANPFASIWAHLTITSAHARIAARFSPPVLSAITPLKKTFFGTKIASGIAHNCAATAGRGLNEM